MGAEESRSVWTGVVHQINLSQGGVPKLPVPHAVVGEEGVEGDRQASRKFHGGPDRALCLFAQEKIEELRAEGHPIQPGTTGENITTRGLEWATLAPGVVLRVGAEVRIEITSHPTPCKTIAGSFSDGRFVRISEKVHSGDSRLYAPLFGDLAPETARPPTRAVRGETLLKRVFCAKGKERRVPGRAPPSRMLPNTCEWNALC